MKWIGDTFEIKGKPLKIFNLLCEGNSQADVALKLNNSRAYVCSVTKELQTFGVIKLSKDSKYTKRYISVFPTQKTPLPHSINPPSKKSIRIKNTRHCKYCDRTIFTSKNNSQQIFCSSECMRKFHQRLKNPLELVLENRIYNPDFDEEFKERVREFFMRMCFICGVRENGTKHAVHHVTNDRRAPCDGSFDHPCIPLCGSCHNMITAMRRPEFMEMLLRNQLIERTGGRYCFTQEEILLHDKNKKYLHA